MICSITRLTCTPSNTLARLFRQLKKRHRFGSSSLLHHLTINGIKTDDRRKTRKQNGKIKPKLGHRVKPSTTDRTHSLNSTTILLFTLNATATTSHSPRSTTVSAASLIAGKHFYKYRKKKWRRTRSKTCRCY